MTGRLQDDRNQPRRLSAGATQKPERLTSCHRSYTDPAGERHPSSWRFPAKRCHPRFEIVPILSGLAIRTRLVNAGITMLSADVRLVARIETLLGVRATAFFRSPVLVG
jgi:hypothetical protein